MVKEKRGIRLLSRNTYLEINLKALEKNIKRLIRMFGDYDYHFGVVKADCYGQSGIKSIKAIIKGGCNYLAVATLDEALDIRKKLDIPILCLGVVSSQYIETCVQNNITITVNSLEYLKEIIEEEPEDLKVHLKINTGMNRLGISDNKEVLESIRLMKDNQIELEGIYTHIYDASNEARYLEQIEKFKNAVKGIDLGQIPIIHISASEALVKYEKLDFVNGCRFGIIMYGFTESEDILLESTAKLVSEVVQIHSLKSGDTVGYDGAFKVNEEMKVAVVSIGYADGVIRKNTGRNVYINDKPYEIIGNICMDMLFVKIDDDVHLHDQVDILRDNEHIKEVAKYLDTIPYEVLCLIGKRVPRVYEGDTR